MLVKLLMMILDVIALFPFSFFSSWSSDRNQIPNTSYAETLKQCFSEPRPSFHVSLALALPESKLTTYKFYLFRNPGFTLKWVYLITGLKHFLGFRSLLLSGFEVHQSSCFHWLVLNFLSCHSEKLQHDLEATTNSCLNTYPST